MEQQNSSTLQRVRLPIRGMSCASCAARVETALAKIPGVSQVTVNLASQQAEIIGSDDLEPSGLVKTINDLGYQVPASQIELSIEGMHCGSCSAKIQRALSQFEGVDQVSVNLATGRASAQTQLPAAALIARIEKLGYRAQPVIDRVRQAATEKAQQQAAQQKLVSDLRWALILALPVVLLEMGGHLIPALHHWLEQQLGRSHLWYLQWLLTTLLLIFPGRRFLQQGIPALLRRAPDMNSLVSVGSLSAYGYSCVATFLPQLLPASSVNVYYEAASTIVLLILVGRYLEARAKSHTSEAIRRLTQLQPATARRWQQGKIEQVAIDQLRVGDQFEVRAGESIALDGEVVEGESWVDESMLTGEAQPIAKKVASLVRGGTIAQQGWLRVKVNAVGGATLLAQIIQLVEQAQGSKLPIQNRLNKITLWFVPTIIGLAVLTFVLWFVFGPDPALSFALVNAVAVLIIACPCAMGLATPTSIMVATGRAAEQGILIRQGEALQKLQQTRVVALDKTGTLTEGKPRLTQLETVSGFTHQQVLTLAASLESRSQHPLALALLDAAQQQQLNLLQLTHFSTIEGQGVQGEIEGRALLLGNQQLLESNGIDSQALAPKAQHLAQQGMTPIYLASAGKLAALFAIEDPLKPGSAEAVAQLKQQGLYVVMISGDHPQVAKRLAERLALDEVIAEVLPADKVTHVQDLQQRYGVVAFVGDGVNDAPALAAADIGLAIGTGTDIAIESADVVLMSGDLHCVNQAIALSKATLRNIHQNLFWAFAYNLALIPVAAGLLYPLFGILLSPIFAAAAMALSSLFVLANALRLKRIKLV